MATASHAEGSTRGRLAINRLGIWLFFLSETFLFGGIIASRYYLRGMERPDEVDQALGLAITATLLLSSLTAYRAETAAARGNHTEFLRNLWGTIALGVAFLAGVGFEWFEAYQHFPPHTDYGTVFFATTGLHATHVLTGVILLGFVAYLGRKPGRFGPGKYWGRRGFDQVLALRGSSVGVHLPHTVPGVLTAYSENPLCGQDSDSSASRHRSTSGSAPSSARRTCCSTTPTCRARAGAGSFMTL